MTIQKLIEQYQAKVAECDRDIELLTNALRDMPDATLDNRRAWFDDRKAKQMVRQAYFQMTKDLEDLEVTK